MASTLGDVVNDMEKERRREKVSFNSASWRRKIHDYSWSILGLEQSSEGSGWPIRHGAPPPTPKWGLGFRSRSCGAVRRNLQASFNYYVGRNICMGLAREGTLSPL